MKNFILTITAIFSFLFFSCTKTENKPADNYLSGKWEQQLPDTIAFYVGAYHSFIFFNDSFKAKIIYWTDVITPLDPCGFVLVDYIKGKYLITNDSIKFTGKLTDSLYKTYQPDCSGTADYNTQYKFTRSDTVIVLNPDQAIYYQDIVLKKR